MPFETPMVNTAVKLSTWGWFSLQCAKEMNVLLYFVNTLENPGMVFLKDGNDFERVSDLMKICNSFE